LTSARVKAGIFSVPAPGTFGNFPFNSLYGPSFSQTDFSLVKRTYFTERANVELRMIVFNAFNQANFTVGNQTFDSTIFGRINGNCAGCGPRQFSFNLAVSW
jgi:hypothetical protein